MASGVVCPAIMHLSTTPAERLDMQVEYTSSRLYFAHDSSFRWKIKKNFNHVLPKWVQPNHSIVSDNESFYKPQSFRTHWHIGLYNENTEQTIVEETFSSNAHTQKKI